jgi:hypothetical protein
MAPIRRVWLVLAVLALVAGGNGSAQGRGPATIPQPPDIVGKWTGVWSAYNPAQASTPPKEQCAKLDASVAQENGIWVATFEGDCGRPYKYTIKMEGRLVGGSVLFKGSADLGPRDGGVFDWIGRATGTEFIGFYTSGYATGTFNMTRVK